MPCARLSGSVNGKSIWVVFLSLNPVNILSPYLIPKPQQLCIFLSLILFTQAHKSRCIHTCARSIARLSSDIHSTKLSLLATRMCIGYSCCNTSHSMFCLTETIATKRTPRRVADCIKVSPTVARGDFTFQCGQSEICSRGRRRLSSFEHAPSFKQPQGNLSG